MPHKLRVLFRCFRFFFAWSWLLGSAVFVLFCSELKGEEHAANGAAVTRPNIILIMADDVGWECFGSYGGQDYKAPRLDKLAQQGIRFRHCYSTPICTTSRVKIMTGKYNFRNYTHFGYLNPKEKTFGHLLKSAGYRTAIAGKWQLNGLYNQLNGYQDRARPAQAGFDEYMLWQLTLPKGGRKVDHPGGERFWSPPYEHNGKLLTKEANRGKYGPDMLCDFVCDFIERSGNDPFFVYYPMVLVHDPFVPTPDNIGSRSRGHERNVGSKDKAVKKKNFVAMVQYMDKIVGRIVDKVESLGKLENTIILFTADNGTNRQVTSQWKGQKIRGGKGGMKDSGTHVPLIAYWKGQPGKGQTPGGQVNEDLIDFTDFYPTFAEAANVKLTAEDPTDGVSFLPQLRGEDGVKREWVFCHYEPYWNKKAGQFLRNGEFKLYCDGRFYRVPNDLEEKHNLAEATDQAVQQQRDALLQVLKTAPPSPKRKKGAKNRNPRVRERPIFPNWQKLGKTRKDGDQAGIE